jgi:hypothetical protein
MLRWLSSVYNTIYIRIFKQLVLRAHKINSLILITARLYFKSRVKFFYILLYNINVPPDKIFQFQFQTNRTFKEISLHFNGTSHSVQGFSHCSWRNMFISVCDTFIYWYINYINIKYKPPASSTFSKCSDENQGIYFMWPYKKIYSIVLDSKLNKSKCLE